MIKLTGQILIKQIQSRRGFFAVGELQTELGVFKVKDAILDQFNEGTYKGTFLVQRIFMDPYVHQGRCVTEIRATVAEIFIDNEAALPDTSYQSLPEPDPIDQESPCLPTSSSGEMPTPNPSGPISDSSPSVNESNPDSQETVLMDLFGDEIFGCIQSNSAIKLDPTVDRTRFRQQRDYLKANGYGFHAATQTWQKI